MNPVLLLVLTLQVFLTDKNKRILVKHITIFRPHFGKKKLLESHKSSTMTITKSF